MISNTSQKPRVKSSRSSTNSIEKIGQKGRRSSFVQNLIADYKSQSQRVVTKKIDNLNKRSQNFTQQMLSNQQLTLLQGRNKIPLKNKTLLMEQNSKNQISFPLNQINIFTQNYKSIEIVQNRKIIKNLAKKQKITNKKDDYMNQDNKYQSQFLKNIFGTRDKTKKTENLTSLNRTKNFDRTKNLDQNISKQNSFTLKSKQNQKNNYLQVSQLKFVEEYNTSICYILQEKNQQALNLLLKIKKNLILQKQNQELQQHDFYNERGNLQSQTLCSQKKQYKILYLYTLLIFNLGDNPKEYNKRSSLLQKLTKKYQKISKSQNQKMIFELHGNLLLIQIMHVVNWLKELMRSIKGHKQNPLNINSQNGHQIFIQNQLQAISRLIVETQKRRMNAFKGNQDLYKQKLGFITNLFDMTKLLTEVHCKLKCKNIRKLDKIQIIYDLLQKMINFEISREQFCVFDEDQFLRKKHDLKQIGYLYFENLLSCIVYSSFQQVFWDFIASECDQLNNEVIQSNSTKQKHRTFSSFLISHKVPFIQKIVQLKGTRTEQIPSGFKFNFQLGQRPSGKSALQSNSCHNQKIEEIVLVRILYFRLHQFGGQEQFGLKGQCDIKQQLILSLQNQLQSIRDKCNSKRQLRQNRQIERQQGQLNTETNVQGQIELPQFSGKINVWDCIKFPRLYFLYYHLLDGNNSYIQEPGSNQEPQPPSIQIKLHLKRLDFLQNLKSSCHHRLYHFQPKQFQMTSIRKQNYKQKYKQKYKQSYQDNQLQQARIDAYKQTIHRWVDLQLLKLYYQMGQLQNCRYIVLDRYKQLLDMGAGILGLFGGQYTCFLSVFVETWLGQNFMYCLYVCWNALHFGFELDQECRNGSFKAGTQNAATGILSYLFLNLVLRKLQAYPTNQMSRQSKSLDSISIDLFGNKFNLSELTSTAQIKLQKMRSAIKIKVCLQLLNISKSSQLVLKPLKQNTKTFNDQQQDQQQDCNYFLQNRQPNHCPGSDDSPSSQQPSEYEQNKAGCQTHKQNKFERSDISKLNQELQRIEFPKQYLIKLLKTEFNKQKLKAKKQINLDPIHRLFYQLHQDFEVVTHLN